MVPYRLCPFCNSLVLKRIIKLKHTLSFLSDLQDSQIETGLLKSCLAFPKISFSLRTCLPSYIRDATDSFDTLILEYLSDQVGGLLPDWSWTKVSLPTSLGVLNIYTALLHSPIAYTGSAFSTQLLVLKIKGYHFSHSTQLSEAFHEFSLSSRHPDWSSSPDATDFPIQQCHLSKAIDLSTFDSFFSNTPSSHLKALALSSTIPHAGDWLNVISFLALGLHLCDQEFCHCLQPWCQSVL